VGKGLCLVGAQGTANDHIGHRGERRGGALGFDTLGRLLPQASNELQAETKTAGC